MAEFDIPVTNLVAPAMYSERESAIKEVNFSGSRNPIYLNSGKLVNRAILDVSFLISLRLLTISECSCHRISIFRKCAFQYFMKFRKPVNSNEISLTDLFLD